jgi:hypothetical protein
LVLWCLVFVVPILSVVFLAHPATATSAPATSKIPSRRSVDLSYLHRTRSSLLAQAFQEALLHKPEEEDDDLDVDVSASFIDKSIQELVSSLEQTDPQPRRQFGIIAQRNQWTSTEATLLLQAIIGPEKEEEVVDKLKSISEVTPKKKKKRRRKEKSSGATENETADGNALSGNKTATLTANVTSLVDGANTTVANTSTTKESSIQVDDDSESNVTVSTTNTSQSDEEETGEEDSPSTIEESPPPSRLLSQGLVRLDLGYNDLGGRSAAAKTNKKSEKAWYQLVQRTIRNCERCPKELRFHVCGLGPAACRAIGKGLIARYANIQKSDTSDDDSSSNPVQLPPPLSVYLTRNEAIGDPGVAALSAAIRTVAAQNYGCTILETLDLSGCGITDAGAEALGVALEQNPFCIRHLDLSNNQITNSGAASLGRALAMRDGDRSSKIETLDLSNNKGIEDSGAKALALALEQGAIDTLILRSCHVHADGAAALVKSLKTLALSQHRLDQIQLDLSGNPLGILRKKPKSGGGKYSATALRSKASATTAAYMNLIGKTVQKGLKDLGIAEAGGPDTLESDDEEDSQMDEKYQEEDPSLIKCGALAIADSLLEEDEEEANSEDEQKPATTSCKIQLGLRHCAFDTRASEALAAIRQELLSSSANMDIVIDVRMNNVLEEDTIAALQEDRDSPFESTLNEMAERYLEAMEALRISQQRSMEAAKVARSRMQAQEEMEDAWGAPVPMGDDDYDYPPAYGDEEDEAWDSDADYDQEDDIAEFY